MGCYPNLFYKLRAIVCAVSCLFVLAACSGEELGDSRIRIHINGGSSGGAYNDLIELLDSRSRTLRNTSILDDGDPSTYISCEQYREGCPLLSKFEFVSKCHNTGGSKRNLSRLGMKAIGEAESIIECIEPPYPASDQAVPEVIAPRSGNDFALVQNFFVAGAAQTYCPYRRNKLGPDALYFFEFTSFPFAARWRTPSQINRECDNFFSEQMDGEYQPFKDLRIVLPLYNGLVQFVTVNSTPSTSSEVTPAPLKTLDNLIGKTSGIFLRGVNEIYAAEVLNRDSRFQNAEIANTEHPEWRFDEKLVLRPDEMASLGLDDDILRFLDINVDTKEFNVPPNFGWAERGDRMLACGIIETYVISGEIISEEKIDLPSDREICKGDFTRQQIQVPEVIIDAMAIAHPYYQKLPPPAYWQKPNVSMMPGLITYLVTTESADFALVNELTTALNEEWDSLMLLDKELTPIRDNVLKRPASYHTGAEQALLEAQMLGGGFKGSTFLWVITLLIGLMIANRFSRSKLAYDRLGEKRKLGLGSLFGQEVLDFFIILCFWGLTFMVVVTLIRNWDAAIAATQNADDQISALTFTRTLLWMFTFISSGYEDNVFPASTAAQVVVSFFAIAGIAYPLFLIAQTWDRIRIKRLNRARGGEFPGFWRRINDWMLERNPWTYRHKEMLLLCGWNDKAPGLIYTLTCPDSPFEGTVNIIANMKAEYPVEFYNFNRNRVRFYRGDPSHRSQLLRAEADRAKSALILSEHSSGSGRNNSGVLTALAIEQFKKKISVFAELSTDDADQEFMKDHIDNIVDPRLIARRALTAGCFDKYVLDFVLDALSPDNQCEWYSTQFQDLTQNLPQNSKIKTAADLSSTLQRYGISVVGICKDVAADNGSVFDPIFDKDLQLDPLRSLASMNRTLKSDDYVVCAALDSKAIKLGPYRRMVSDSGKKAAFAQSGDSIITSLRSSADILIIGHGGQAKAISDHIKEIKPQLGKSTAIIRTSIIATEEAGIKLDEIIETKLREQKTLSHILLLSSVPEAKNQEEYTNLASRADSDTILRATFIRSLLKNINKNEGHEEEEKEKGKKDAKLPIIVCEVNHTHSRQLARDAQIKTAVPSSLLIERMLARLVSGGGKVPAMLSAMLSMRDDVYLRSAKLHEDHPLLGKNYSTALNTWYKDGRVMGILPKSRPDEVMEKQTNSSDDFDWHFIMCPPSVEDDLTLQIGDVVIILACSGSAVPD